MRARDSTRAAGVPGTDRASAPAGRTERPGATSAAPAGIEALQRLAGNAAVSRMLTGRDETTEDDATPHQAAVPPTVRRSAVHQVLASPGRPLDTATRRHMEAGLNADLSRVRLHTDAAAGDSAEQLHAEAWTSGEHVVFDGPVDDHTLAHELTHVVQQRRGPVAGTDDGDGLTVSDPGDRFEREAEATARTITSGAAPPGRAGPATMAPVGRDVQRAPDTAGTSAGGLSTPPDRLTLTETDGGIERPAGQIGGGDRVLSIDTDDDAVIEALVLELGHVLDADEQDEVRAQVASRLRVQALQPQLSRLTRGDVLLVPLDIGRRTGDVEGVTSDITGDVEVTARVIAATTLDTREGVEFEDGSETFTSVTEIEEERSRWQGGGNVGGTPPNASVTGQVTYLQDRNTRELDTTSGRSFGRTKTKQTALRMNATVEIDLDISGLRGPRLLAVGPRRDVPPPQQDPERNAAALTRLTARVASPADDAADAPGPSRHFAPPKRIRQTHSLGGTDVVQDVYTIDANGRRTRAGVRGLLGSTDDPASVAGRGQRLFGSDWPAVRADLLAHLTMTSLQSGLKAMTVGDGVEIPLSDDRGSVLVAAEVTRMNHVRNTRKTEFTIGSDTTRTFLSSRGADRRWEGEGTGSGSAAPGPVSGGGTALGEYGWDNRVDEQHSMRSGNAIKVKTAGAIFDGIARLTFTLRKGPAGGTADQRRSYGRLGFRVAIEANDAEKVDKPTPFVATGARQAMTAPTFEPGTKVRKPRAEFWPGRWGRGGLPSSTVVLDVLAGTDARGEPVAHNPVATMAGDLGSRHLADLWASMRPQVRAAFSRERLAASLPAMTRGVPLQSGPLIRPRAGVLRTTSRLSATARLRQLDYVREIGDDAELNVLNDAGRRSAAQHTTYQGGGAQGQLTGTAPRVYSATGSGGAIVRLRDGSRVATGSGTIASGKFPRPMVVYIATADVDMDLLESGSAGPEGTGTVTVRFLVAVPRSRTTEHELYTGSRTGKSRNTGDLAAAFTEEPEPPPLQGATGAATPAPTGGVGPERVRTTGRIGASDVVVGLEDDMAVVQAVEGDLRASFGDHWSEAQAQLLTLFDAAVLRPLVPALTQGRSWGATVEAGGRKADVHIVAASARMTEHTEHVRKFEFEIGTDSTSSSGTVLGDRLRIITRGEESVAAPVVTVTTGVTTNQDRLREGVQDESATAVSRGKPVEPAELYNGELTFTVEVCRPGGTVRDVAATMRGEFAFPTRDVEPREAPRRRPPSRITETHRLGATDIVTGLLPPPSEEPEAHPTDGTAASAGRLTPGAVVDQLRDAGIRAYGSERAWAAASVALEKKLDLDTLRTNLRSMMAGQAWTLDLGRHGSVAITAGLSTLAPADGVPEAEFNTGVSGGTTFAGTTAGPTDEWRQAYAPSLGPSFTIGPASWLAALVFSITGFYERGRDRTTDHTVAAPSGTGTKSKAPAVVFAGDAVLHVEFRPGGTRHSAASDVPAHGGDVLAEIGDIRQEIADLESGRGRLPPDWARENESQSDAVTRRIEWLAAIRRRQVVERLSPQVRAAEARVRFTALVELPDTTEVDDPADARFAAGTPDPDSVRAGRASARAADAPGSVPVVAPDRRGLATNWIIRDLPDVGSLHKLLDVYGRRVYADVWDAQEEGGQPNSELVKQAFSREELMADLARLTRGGRLESPRFRVNLAPAWVDVTASVVDLAQARTENAAEVALLGEVSTRYRDRGRVSHLNGGTGQLGGEATRQAHGLNGRGLLTRSVRDRRGVEVLSGGRVFANAKVPTDLIRFDGFVRFSFTFHLGDDSAESTRESGIVPFTVAIPEEETVVFEEREQRSLRHDTDVTGGEMTAEQTAETIRNVEQHLGSTGVGSAAFVSAGGRRHVDDVDLYRVDAVERDAAERDRTPRIEWRDARTRRLLHPPWDARTLDVHWLDRPGTGTAGGRANRPIGPQRPAGGTGAPSGRSAGLRELRLRPPAEGTGAAAGATGVGRQGQQATGQQAGSVGVQRPFFGSHAEAEILALEDLRGRSRQRRLGRLDGPEQELRRLRREHLDRAYGLPLGPKHGRPKPPEIDDVGDLRLNPLRYRLEDFPPALLLDRKGVVWHFSVVESGEILIGAENPFDLLEEGERTALQDGMHQAHPDLTDEELRRQLTDQGHPTITAGFDRTGRTTLQSARVSGELRWNEDAARFEVIDRSGRYMHPTVRPGVTPANATRWLTNVAGRLARHFGVPVHPVLHERA